MMSNGAVIAHLLIGAFGTIGAAVALWIYPKAVGKMPELADDAPLTARVEHRALLDSRWYVYPMIAIGAPAVPMQFLAVRPDWSWIGYLSGLIGIASLLVAALARMTRRDIDSNIRSRS